RQVPSVIPLMLNPPLLSQRANPARGLVAHHARQLGLGNPFSCRLLVPPDRTQSGELQFRCGGRSTTVFHVPILSKRALCPLSIALRVDPEASAATLSAHSFAFSRSASIPIARRPMRIAEISVVPLPQNGSTIRSPGSVQSPKISIIR